MPKVRASSGMIGTTRLPTFVSRSRFRSSRAKAIVVEAAAVPEPLANSLKADGSGSASLLVRTTRFGTEPPSALRRSSMYRTSSLSMPGW